MGIGASGGVRGSYFGTGRAVFGFEGEIGDSAAPHQVEHSNKKVAKVGGRGQVGDFQLQGRGLDQAKAGRGGETPVVVSWGGVIVVEEGQTGGGAAACVGECEQDGVGFPMIFTCDEKLKGKGTPLGGRQVSGEGTKAEGEQAGIKEAVFGFIPVAQAVRGGGKGAGQAGLGAGKTFEDVQNGTQFGGGAVETEVDGLLHGIARGKAKAVIGTKEARHEVGVVQVEPVVGRIAELADGKNSHSGVQGGVIKIGGVGQVEEGSVRGLLKVDQTEADQFGLEILSEAIGLGLKMVGVDLRVVVSHQSAAQSAPDDSGGGAEQERREQGIRKGRVLVGVQAGEQVAGGQEGVELAKGRAKSFGIAGGREGERSRIQELVLQANGEVGEGGHKRKLMPTRCGLPVDLRSRV